MLAVVSTMAINGNKRRSSLNVLGETTTMNWDALECHQSLADLMVRSRIDLTTLGIPEELVQGVVISLAGIIGGMLANISSVTDGVVNRSVRRRLLRGIVAIVCRMVWVVVRRSRGRVHLSTVIIIRSGSCKMMQISDHCSLGQTWV